MAALTAEVMKEPAPPHKALSSTAGSENQALIHKCRAMLTRYRKTSASESEDVLLGKGRGEVALGCGPIKVKRAVMCGISDHESKQT